MSKPESPIDLIRNSASTSEAIEVYVTTETGEIVTTLKFRRARSFAEIRKLKQVAKEKANEFYDVILPGRLQSEQKDEIKLEIIAQCCLMESLNLHPKGQVTVQNLYDLSEEFGSMFAVIVEQFGMRLAWGEAKSLSESQENAKN